MKEIYNGQTVALGGPNLVTKELVVDESTGEKAEFTYDKTTGAIAVQDEVDEDSVNPVTSRAVAKAIEQGGGGTEYTAGDGIAISEGEISAKVDGTTIGVNASGELEAIGGGGGTEYTAGSGIAISAGDEISVDYDTGSLRLGTDANLSTSSDYALSNLLSTYNLSGIKTNRGLTLPVWNGSVHLVFGSDSSNYAVSKQSVQFDAGTMGNVRFTLNVPAINATNYDITGNVYPADPAYITIVGTSGDANSPNGETAIEVRDTNDTSDVYFTGIANGNKLAVLRPVPSASPTDAGKVLGVLEDGSIGWITLT